MDMMTNCNRAYIRHPTGVPIELAPTGIQRQVAMRMRDVSVGGLSLFSETEITLGDMIAIRIPLVEPPFETVGKVVWCHPNAHGFEIGVQFISEQDAFAARMVEQVCHIEQYRQHVAQKEQRDLSPEEAAQEWIGKYAGDFPTIN